MPPCNIAEEAQGIGLLSPLLAVTGKHESTPSKLAEVPWRDQVEIVNGDVTDPPSVRAAVSGQDVVYYLVHSLNRHDFVDVDRRAAQVLAQQARAASTARLVYLGGITPEGDWLSDHLASRAEVGRILASWDQALAGAI